MSKIIPIIILALSLRASSATYDPLQDFLNIYVRPLIGGGFAILPTTEKSFRHSLTNYLIETTNLVASMNNTDSPPQRILGYSGTRDTIAGVVSLLNRTLTANPTDLMAGADYYFTGFTDYIGGKLKEMGAAKEFLTGPGNPEYRYENTAMISIFTGQNLAAAEALKLVKAGFADEGVVRYILRSLDYHKELEKMLTNPKPE